MSASRRLRHAVAPAAAAATVLSLTALPAMADPGQPAAATGLPSAAAQCGALASGSTGPAVKTIQTALGITADGDFGPATQTRLERFQRRHNIPATGVVDAATWAALPQQVSWAACGQQVAAVVPQGAKRHCATLTTGDIGPAVAVLQAAVQTTVDGGYGPKTARAVKAVQRQHQWTATGGVGYRVWKALGLTSTPACELGPAGTATTPTPTPAPQPPDAAQQARIRKRVARIVSQLSGPAATADPMAQAALKFAQAQVGKPYVYGAEGPGSYDCSGLTMASYDAAALPLPRVAADQYAAGPHVPLSHVQQGDLLFFASDVANPATTYHAAIYVGNGQVLNAPHTGTDVQVENLWSTDLLPQAVRPTRGLALPLQAGDTGLAVKELQTALTHHGYEIPVDGGFGASTVAAVKDWQQKQGLRRTGRVNEALWLTLGWTPGH